MRCTVNPLVGRESEASLEPLPPAAVRKKVLVVGAGVAGLEAARTAAARGHDVVIYEGTSMIGGQLNLASALPGRDDLGSMLEVVRGSAPPLGVRIEFRKEIASPRAGGPRDRGGETGRGGDRDRLKADHRRDAAVRLLDGAGQRAYPHRGPDPLGRPSVGREHILLMDESAFVEGLSLSEMLANRGSHVELITRDPAPGSGDAVVAAAPLPLREGAPGGGRAFTPNTFIGGGRARSVSLLNVYTGEAQSRNGGSPLS